MVPKMNFIFLLHCQENKNLRIAGYVLMPNHLHLICAGSRTHPLSDTMRDFKQYTAKKIIEELTLDRRSKEIKIFQMAALEDACLLQAGKGKRSQDLE